MNEITVSHMVTRNKTYYVTTYGTTDIGCVRQINEDVWGKVPELCFFVLADGMGGHQAGDVASRITVEQLCTYMKNELSGESPTITLGETSKLVETGIEFVNRNIWELGVTHQKYKGMGTTLCCLQFHSDGLVYAHVGDSRIYRIRDQKIEALTRDHSLLRELLDMGQIDEQQAKTFSYKNIITRAIGSEPFISPSINSTSVQNDDLYLMCSDGLTDLLSALQIENIINQSATIEETVKRLIEEAKNRGGHDNITVVMIKVHEVDEK